MTMLSTSRSARDGRRRRFRRGVSFIDLTIGVLVMGIVAAAGGVKYSAALQTARSLRSIRRAGFTSTLPGLIIWKLRT